MQAWLQREREKLDGSLITTTAGGIWPVGVLALVLGLIASLVTAGNSPSGGFPGFGWIFVALGIGGLVAWIMLGVPAGNRTEALRQAKRKERAQDPLWQRAELILNTVGIYGSSRPL